MDSNETHLVLNPDYKARIRADKEFIKNQRENPLGDTWTNALGTYSGARVFRDQDQNEIVEGLEGLEIDLFRHIQKLLQQEIGKPVVIGDFGGGFGISLCRLAQVFKGEIEEGKLVLFVTNAAFVPDQEKVQEIFQLRQRLKESTKRSRFLPDLRKKKDEERLQELTGEIGKNAYAWLRYGSPEELEPLVSNMQYVNYLQSSFQELGRKKITNFKGDEIQLQGNVDLLVENNAFIHMNALDVAIPTLARNLSSQGTLYTRAEIGDFEKNEERQLRKDDFLKGIANLEAVGVSRVDFGQRRSFYSVFQKPQAPKLNDIE